MRVDIVRDTALVILLQVFERGAYLSIALDNALRRRRLSARGRRFLTQLVYGTVRHKLLCDHVLERIVHQPLEKLPRSIHAILRMGVFQSLFCAQVTRPAMVHTSVDLTKKRGHSGTVRLVNAVLRRVPESLDDIRFPDAAHDRISYLSVRHSIPQWLVEHWIEEHGEATAAALCEAANVRAPTTLRANTLTTTPEKLIGDLGRKDCVAEKRTPIPEEVTLLEGEPPARSHLFRNGHFLVQDPASMLVPHLLEPRPGERVLDLCAAPGGKTTHLAQLAGGRAQVVAMDVYARQRRLVRENVTRLKIPDIALLCGDGR